MTAKMCFCSTTFLEVFRFHLRCMKCSLCHSDRFGHDFTIDDLKDYVYHQRTENKGESHFIKKSA